MILTIILSLDVGQLNLMKNGRKHFQQVGKNVISQTIKDAKIKNLHNENQKLLERLKNLEGKMEALIEYIVE